MTDITDKLERLANLLEKGLITREEFESEKSALIADRGSGGTVPPGALPTLTPNQAPTTLGSYTILGEIGQGGMGAVYRARHRSETFAAKQGGDVAIKVLHPQYASRPDIVERFEREADMGIKLEHPGIVRALELVIDSGRVALVMELVAGQPMDAMIGQVTGPIPWDRAEPMFQQLLDAVGFAHEHGVVHRDLKPENTIVGTDGQLKVLDFGIAKDLTSDKTRTGTGMGTVDYMAPEQYLDAKAVDQRADIYALGMTLYEMLAGRLPWDPSSTEFGILEAKKKGELPPPTDFYPDIPPHVVAAVAKATEKEVGDRFLSTELFGAALGMESRPSSTLGVASTASTSPVSAARPEPAVSAPTVSAPVATTPTPAPTPVAASSTTRPAQSNRGPWLAILAFAGFGLVVAGGMWFLNPSSVSVSDEARVEASEPEAVEELESEDSEPMDLPEDLPELNRWGIYSMGVLCNNGPKVMSVDRSSERTQIRFRMRDTYDGTFMVSGPGQPDSFKMYGVDDSGNRSGPYQLEAVYGVSTNVMSSTRKGDWSFTLDFAPLPHDVRSIFLVEHSIAKQQDKPSHFWRCDGIYLDGPPD